MENLKIRVANDAESKEAQELFFELGYGWPSCGKSVSYLNEVGTFTHLVVRKNKYYEKPIIQMGCCKDDCREITLQQLRDLVLEQQVASHNIEQQAFNGINFIDKHMLKIKPRLYLDPKQGYMEIEWDGTTFKSDDWIEVPEWANYAYDNDQGICFLKDEVGFNHPLLLWQRTQDEPFLTPESVVNVMESLASNGIRLAPRNSKQSISIHGTIEPKLDPEPQEDALVGVDATLAERQSTYGNFEDVAFVTENIMGVLAKVRVNGLNDLPNPHRMALYMIASKMARIVNGDCNHKDSWHDIAGYAKLIENLIKE